MTPKNNPHHDQLALYEFIKDFWSFMKAYWNIIDDDAWWDSFYDQGNKLAEKYANENQAVFQTVKKQISSFMLTQQERYLAQTKRWKAVKVC